MNFSWSNIIDGEGAISVRTKLNALGVQMQGLNTEVWTLANGGTGTNLGTALDNSIITKGVGVLKSTPTANGAFYATGTNTAPQFGILPVGQGGTGVSSLEQLITSIGITPIERGGTGATTTAGARNALGLGNTSGALPIANGGTNATSAASARTNLGITYGTSAPSGVPATGNGAIYFQLIS